jgi:hypothetical protein
MAQHASVNTPKLARWCASHYLHEPTMMADVPKHDVVKRLLSGLSGG